MTGQPEAPHLAEAPQAPPLTSPGTPEHDRYIHSDIFDKLVDDEDDLVGLVAYGLYQQRKRQWMSEHLKRNGTSPSEDDLKAYAFGHILGFIVLVAAVYFFTLFIRYEPMLDRLPGLGQHKEAPAVAPKPLQEK